MQSSWKTQDKVYCLPLPSIFKFILSPQKGRSRGNCSPLQETAQHVV